MPNRTFFIDVESRPSARSRALPIRSHSDDVTMFRGQQLPIESQSQSEQEASVSPNYGELSRRIDLMLSAPSVCAADCVDREGSCPTTSSTTRATYCRSAASIRRCFRLSKRPRHRCRRFQSHRRYAVWVEIPKSFFADGLDTIGTIPYSRPA